MVMWPYFCTCLFKQKGWFGIFWDQRSLFFGAQVRSITLATENTLEMAGFCLALHYCLCYFYSREVQLCLPGASTLALFLRLWSCSLSEISVLFYRRCSGKWIIQFAAWPGSNCGCELPEVSRGNSETGRRCCHQQAHRPPSLKSVWMPQCSFCYDEICFLVGSWHVELRRCLEQVL